LSLVSGDQFNFETLLLHQVHCLLLHQAKRWKLWIMLDACLFYG